MDQSSTGLFSEIGPREIAMLDEHLSHLHKERWAVRLGGLHRQLKTAPAGGRDAVQQQLDAHYDNRFKPETSRAAILAQLEVNAAKRQPRRETTLGVP